MVLEPELDVARLEFRELEAVLALVQVLAYLFDQIVVRIGLDGEVMLQYGHLTDRVDEHSVAPVADPTTVVVVAIAVVANGAVVIIMRH